MKRTRAEKYQNAVLTTLKRQNFCDSQQTFRNNFSFDESVIDMSQRLIKESAGGSGNVVGLMVFQLEEYTTAYQQLRDRLQKLTPAPGSGLREFSVLTFVHMYLDLVEAGRADEAVTFFTTHSTMPLIAQDKLWVPLLKEVRSAEQISSSSVFSKLHSNYMEVRLPLEEHQMITELMSSEENTALLRTVHNHMKLVIHEKEVVCFDNSFKNSAKQHNKKKEASSSSSLVTSTSLASSNDKKEHQLTATNSITLVSPSSFPALAAPTKSTNHDPSHTSATTVTPPKLTRAAVDEVIENFRQSAPGRPSIMMFKLENDLEGLTHGTFSNNNDLLSLGFESSTALLCRLEITDDEEPMVIRPRKREADVSRVTFFGDKYVEAPAPTSHRYHDLRAHSGPVYDSCFTHDDQLLLTCSEDSTVRAWSTKDYLNKALYQGHQWSVGTISCSSHSFYFATGSLDRTVRLWSTERTYPLRIYVDHEYPINTVTFHSNATLLASACKWVRLWDVNTAKIQRRYNEGHLGEIFSLVFSNNGQWLATGGQDGVVNLWDIRQSRILKQFRAHTSPVYSLNFSPADLMMVSASLDGRICVLRIDCNSPQDSAHVVMNEAFTSSSSNPAAGPDHHRLLTTKFIAENLVYALETTKAD